MAAPRPGQPPPSKKAPLAPSPEPGQQPDDIIGEFRRGKEIGKGSFANVYLAQHRKKKSYAAVKVVQMSKLTPRLKSNLDLEINLLRDMHHPHIVALFTTIEKPLYFYLVMEYCPLSDLSQFLKKRHSLSNYPETQDIFRRYPNPEHGGFHEVLSRHFIKQIASALDYLNSKNLIHRDIKPQNLLLNPAPSYMAKQRPEDVPLAASEHSLVTPVGVQTLPMLKVADFGFARHLPTTSLAETLCGSPLYMAPEILKYEKYNNVIDLWSAGGVLYEMVVGKPPFRAQNHVELLRKIERANDSIPFDSKIAVSREMKDLIRGLLTKNPLDRFSHKDFFAHPLISGDIPGLVEDDKEHVMPRARAELSEISRRMAEQTIDGPSTERRSSSDTASKSRPSTEETPRRASKKHSDQDMKQLPEDIRRPSTDSGATLVDTGRAQIQRRTSQREPQKQRRPSIVAHQTAPAREHLVGAAPPPQPAAAKMERRPSRTSPLAGPPMVRETSAVDPAKQKGDRTSREIRERTAQDVAFEKEYVMIEKRAVEINAFADELDANRGSPSGNQGAMVRRATTQGQPVPVAGVQPSSPSRAISAANRQPHQRAGSFERRYAPNPQSATQNIAKVLKAANVRLFGAFGTSPPFGRVGSPSPIYGAYPTYPSTQSALPFGDGADGKTPMDEDVRVVRILEAAATRSNVAFGFADVKYRQLLPATPSTADALGIQQLGAVEGMSKDADQEDKDMTTVAIVSVAEEALVLYVKTLAILAKTIDLAGHWWSKQNRNDRTTPEDSSRASSTAPSEVGRRVNHVVQWARDRFNVCLEKSEVVARKLQAAQKQLPEDHPGHPDNQVSDSKGLGGAITASAEHIHITSGVTAEKLMFERAVEMSRTAAVNELVGESLEDCEISYETAVFLLEVVLERDDEPLMRKPSAQKDKAGDEVVNGMETEDRQTVIKIIDGTRARLSILRKKRDAAQQAAKRTSVSGSDRSGHSTPKPTANPSTTTATAIASTPPRA